MTSIGASDTFSNETVDSKEKRRLIVIKIFLAMAIFNNLYIAFACFMLNGGRFLEHAPQLTLWVVGAAAVLTVFGAVGALFWRKAGVMAVIAAGTIAAISALVATLWFHAGMFLMGTAFMALLAYHLWHRFK
jgi:hypothetical protein